MIVFVVTTRYYDDGILGTFSSPKKACEAIEQVLNTAEDIAQWEYTGDYTYLFTTTDGERNYFTILYDVVDGIIT